MILKKCRNNYLIFKERPDCFIILYDTKIELKGDIRRIGIIIENEIKPDIKTLYEAQIQTNEHLERIDKKLGEHDRRFDVLENN